MITSSFQMRTRGAWHAQCAKWQEMIARWSKHNKNTQIFAGCRGRNTWPVLNASYSLVFFMPSNLIKQGFSLQIQLWLQKVVTLHKTKNWNRLCLLAMILWSPCSTTQIPKELGLNAMSCKPPVNLSVTENCTKTRYLMFNLINFTVFLNIHSFWIYCLTPVSKKNSGVEHVHHCVTCYLLTLLGSRGRKLLRFWKWNSALFQLDIWLQLLNSPRDLFSHFGLRKASHFQWRTSLDWFYITFIKNKLTSSSLLLCVSGRGGSSRKAWIWGRSRTPGQHRSPRHDHAGQSGGSTGSNHGTFCYTVVKHLQILNKLDLFLFRVHLVQEEKRGPLGGQETRCV